MRCRSTNFLTWLFTATLAMVLTAPLAQAELEFGIPTPMTQFNLGASGYPWLTEDGLDIYFASDRSDLPGTPGSVNIWTAHRDSLADAWDEEDFVELGSEINTPGLAEFAQSLTEDGQEMYFMRAISPFGLAQGDLFYSTRQPDNSWGPAQPLVELNTPEREAYPTISRDGLTLYFNTHLNDNYPNPNGLPWNMYVSHRANHDVPFTTAEFFFGGYGTVSPDGLTHIFFLYPELADYYYVPNVGDGDLYIRTRESVDDDWGEIQWLKPPVNSSGQFLPPPLTGVGIECCAFLSAADSTLYFTTIRPGTDMTGALGFVDLWQAPIAQSVVVDIKPGSDTAPVNLKSKGKLPVAILSTMDFDATQVDAETLLFGDPLLIGDGKTPVSPLQSSYSDVNSDGLMDLTLKFSMEELLANEVIGAETMEGYLAGQLYDGTEIAGRDAVTIVPASKVATTPEPSSLSLILLGVAALTTRRKR